MGSTPPQQRFPPFRHFCLTQTKTLRAAGDELQIQVFTQQGSRSPRPRWAESVLQIFSHRASASGFFCLGGDWWVFMVLGPESQVDVVKGCSWSENCILVTSSIGALFGFPCCNVSSQISDIFSWPHVAFMKAGKLISTRLSSDALTFWDDSEAHSSLHGFVQEQTTPFPTERITDRLPSKLGFLWLPHLQDFPRCRSQDSRRSPPARARLLCPNALASSWDK